MLSCFLIKTLLISADCNTFLPLLGIQYTYIIVAIVMTGIAMMYIYMPVFHGLKLTSTYQVSAEIQRNNPSTHFN